MRGRLSAKIYAALLLEFSQQVVDQNDVEVFASQACVAIGGLDFEHLQDRYIESPSSKIANGYNR
jgi:hypothetical protein